MRLIFVIICLFSINAVAESKVLKLNDLLEMDKKACLGILEKYGVLVPEEYANRAYAENAAQRILKDIASDTIGPGRLPYSKIYTAKSDYMKP